MHKQNSRIPFPLYHMLELLSGYAKQDLPLDMWMNRYFRSHKAIGSKDKKFIAENAYALVRWKNTLHFFTPGGHSWKDLWHTYQSPNWQERRLRENLPSFIRHGFPEELFQCLVETWGPDKAKEIAEASNTEAPPTIRVNLLKTSREQLLRHLPSDYAPFPSPSSRVGITFARRFNFFEIPAFKEGFFEVQDEGSQLIADLVRATPGQQVLDYCSGSGGKALAIAPRLGGKGQLYLHDIRLKALAEAKKRLKRAGVQNGQIVDPGNSCLRRLKRQMDWVLVDTPCSGTGTLRRNPDMKWRFSKEMLDRLTGTQRNIFETALSFVKAGGFIVYATCSVLKQENEDQVAHFLSKYPLRLAGESFSSVPTPGGMDGFFGVIFQRI